MSGKTVSSAGLEALAVIVLGALAGGCAPQGAVVQPTPQGAAAASASSAPPTALPAAAAAMPAPPPSTPAPPPPILPLDQAVGNAAHAVFTNAPASDAAVITVVIDPLIDGMTGYASRTTQSIQDQITGIVKKDFPQYAVQRITPDSLKQNARVLIGTFTAVNAQMKTTAEREAYRFCLVLIDLKSGKVVAKSVVRVRIEDADATPTAAFGDSPVWTDDPSIQAYITTCQGSKVGDPIKPEYLDGLLAAALVSDADDAYNEGRYAEALDLYTTARKTPAGDQLRVYNGIYLSLTKLGRTDAAAAAFRDLVDYGIRRKRLAVKFLFRPGSVRFVTDNNMFSGSYGTWLQLIAAQAVS